MSAPEEDHPPPLKPALVDDQDEVFAPMLGPTLDWLKKKKATKGKLTPGDIAGFIAVERALAEMRGETWLSISFEAADLIGEELAGPGRWGKLKARDQAKAKLPRDERLRAIANERDSDPDRDDSKMATDFLDEARADPNLSEPGLRKELTSLLVRKNKDGDDELMEDRETPMFLSHPRLRHILGER